MARAVAHNLNGTKGQWDKETFLRSLSPALPILYQPLFSRTNGRWPRCSAEPTVAGRRVKQFPNSAAVSISIFNAIKPAAVSRIANPDTHCGRITNAPELGVIGEMAMRGNGSLENRRKSRACAVIIILHSPFSIKDWAPASLSPPFPWHSPGWRHSGS